MLPDRKSAGPSLLLFLLFFGLCLTTVSLQGVAQTPRARIEHGISDNDRVTLAGSRAHFADSRDDQGPLASDRVLHGISLVFKRSPEQEADLQALQEAQADAGSPQFHQWLTPADFAARFGVADADLEATRNWLAAAGFTVEKTPASRDRLNFSGSVAQIERAFHPQLHAFLHGRERHFAGTADLSLPAALAPLTLAVLHLSDVRPEPMLHPLASPQPLFTTSSGQAHYLAPADLAVMYDAAGLPSLGSRSAIAVVGESYVNPGSAVSNFQFYNFGANPVTAVLVPDSGVNASAPGSLAEGELDLEYASSIAQNSDVFYVYVGDNANYNVFDAMVYAIQLNLAPVISVSYGLCETFLSATDVNQFNGLFSQAAAQGQTIVASSGDSGSTGCSRFTSNGLTVAQQQALATSFPADSPYVTAVGGTQMAQGTFTAGANPFWSVTQTFPSTATLLSYAPEVAWNEGSAAGSVLAGGGGASTVFTRPAWQTGVPGIAAGTARLVPDISLQASTQNPGFVLCTTDAAFFQGEGQTASCSNGLLGNNGVPTLAGGTSFSAPVVAGFVAGLNQAVGALGQGLLNPTLYKLAANAAVYASAFHDITSGSNACVAGSANCGAAGMSGYSAGVGFDEATGLGSIDLKKLIAAWPSGGGSPTKQITRIALQGTPASAAPGTSVSVQIRIDATSNGATTLPSGTVSVALDGSLVNPSLPIVGSSASIGAGVMTYSFTTPPSVGSHVVQVTYPGDATHTAARTTLSVPVGNAMASGSLGLSATNIVLRSGSAGTSTVQVTPGGGYHGRVFWSLALTGGTGSLTGCYSINPLLVNGSTSTTLQLGTGAACTASGTSNFRFGPPAAAKNIGHALPSAQGTEPSLLAFASGIAGTLALFRRKNRKNLAGMLPSVLLLGVAGICLGGCGGSSTSAPTPTPAQPAPNNFTMTLTGRDSVNNGISAQTSFTLTVNN